MPEHTSETQPPRPGMRGAHVKGQDRLVLMRVCEGGTVAVSGLSRFPVTLNRDQWLRLLDMGDEIRAFIAANEGQLKP
jgi:hypothetical protein